MMRALRLMLTGCAVALAIGCSEQKQATQDTPPPAPPGAPTKGGPAAGKAPSPPPPAPRPPVPGRS